MVSHEIATSEGRTGPLASHSSDMPSGHGPGSRWTLGRDMKRVAIPVLSS